MATYTKELEEQVIDENVRLKKVETKEVESYVSVSDLKRRHADVLSQIEILKEEADRVVDEIQAVNDDVNIDITVKEIPSKLVEVKEVEAVIAK